MVSLWLVGGRRVAFFRLVRPEIGGPGGYSKLLRYGVDVDAMGGHEEEKVKRPVLYSDPIEGGSRHGRKRATAKGAACPTHCPEGFQFPLVGDFPVASRATDPLRVDLPQEPFPASVLTEHFNGKLLFDFHHHVLNRLHGLTPFAFKKPPDTLENSLFQPTYKFQMES